MSVQRGAEQRVVGSVLRDNSCYWQIADLETIDFGDGFARQAWRGIRELVAGNEPVDVFLLADHTGLDFTLLGDMVTQAPSTANIRAYADVVKRESRRRRVVLSLQNALESITEQDPDQVATDLLAGLQDTRQVGKDVDADASLTGALASAKVTHARLQNGELAGISTTLSYLNQLTGGLYGPKMITIGGRPGTYKTALAWQIACRCAVDGTAAGFISLEMGHDELGTRMIANLLQIDGHRLSSGAMGEIKAAERGISEAMRSMPLWIDDSTQNWDGIEARIVEWKHKHDIQIAFVDYLQIVSHPGKRFDALSDISRRTKLLAKRLDMPVVLLSQLTREVERENRRPMMSDLRECGNIEQDSDIILLTHCQKAKDDHEQDKYELILAKQRAGPARKNIPLAITPPHYHIAEDYPRY